MKLQKYIIVVALLLQQAVSAEEIIHVIGKGSSSYEALSSLKLQKRLIATAAKYKKYGAVARVTHYDMAYPIDESEYQRMNGFGILWVTAHSQTQQELPIENLRLQLKGKSDISLSPSYSFMTKEKHPDAAKVLGKYRFDGIYKIPFRNGVQEALLVTDYAINRKDFALGSLEKAFSKRDGEII